MVPDIRRPPFLPALEFLLVCGLREQPEVSNDAHTYGILLEGRINELLLKIIERTKSGRMIA